MLYKDVKSLPTSTVKSAGILLIAVFNFLSSFDIQAIFPTFSLSKKALKICRIYSQPPILKNSFERYSSYNSERIFVCDAKTFKSLKPNSVALFYDLCKHGKWHKIQNGNRAGKSQGCLLPIIAY